MLSFKQKKRLLLNASNLTMKKVVFIFGLILVATNSYSQLDKSKSVIGIQANIFLNENLFTGNYIQPVWAFRYGYHLNNNLSFGPEISGTRTYWRSMNIRDTKFTTLTLGGFGRFAIFSDKRICPFAELSLYYFRSHFTPSTDPVASTLTERIENKFTGYIAPGISIKSKSKKFSFDLMYKFSPDYFVNSKRAVFSYRINLHF